MFYILNENYRLRGWQKLPFAIYNHDAKASEFMPHDLFMVAVQCDGHHDIKKEALTERQQKFLDNLIDNNVIRKALYGEDLLPEQKYKLYPCRYKQSAHWSITGKCNLKCRHCFMSAPGGKHGSPSFEQLISVLDQLEECGVCQVGITGGEPLIRSDFLELVSQITARGIGIDCIYTNGWLVDEKLLDALETTGRKIPFQLSFDGVGQHDFLRGIEGCEERTLNAIRLLTSRGYHVNISTCLHRKNVHTIRDTVKLMASLGVNSMKFSTTMELGEWADPQLRDITLTRQEELEAVNSYIPQFFEDNAPISLMLSGTFRYDKREERWSVECIRPCSTEVEGHVLSCGSLKTSFYIGADGMVAPCMGMCDCDYAKNFPNLYETPLREILGESHFMELCSTTVKEIRDGNDKCRNCEHMTKCKGGCRNIVLTRSNNFYEADENFCSFFKNGWDIRMSSTASKHYLDYCKKNGLTPKVNTTADDENTCG